MFLTGDLKTRCPHCQVAFRVSQSQLDAARGMVRCGVCFKAFSGIDHLLGDNQQTSPAPKPKESKVPFHWEQEEDFFIDDNFDLTRLEGASQERASTPGPVEADADLDAGRTEAVEHGVVVQNESLPTEKEELSEGWQSLTIDASEMMHWRSDAELLIADGHRAASDPTPQPAQKNWVWHLGSVIALVVLSLQLIFFNSTRIARDSPLQPLAELVCGALGCPLANGRNLGLIHSGELVIRSHPEVANALMVDAVIRNDADFPQPFPSLTLRFEDLQGTVVAERTFFPREYLKGEFSASSQMPSHHSVKLEMEIVDPGKEAVSFRLWPSE